ncbi:MULTISPECIES: hypothetical protein [unclassified Psychrobacter]|uniref:hypothetical protein n=1 Tax=unclassified Psychrobacter TaxID=196806 RepID=UPI001787DE25|nr:MULTISPECIES: hypothetical protein [unclassified Psychrobacter]MBE0441471.1 hypothetical protein [Psychrobacter sp. FME13]
MDYRHESKREQTSNFSIGLRSKLGLNLGSGLLCALMLSACQQADTQDTTNNQADNASQTGDATNTAMQDSTSIQFPQYIHGTPALLHPITPIDIEDQETGLSSIKSRKGEMVYPIFEQQSTYRYHTHANNFVFEEIATGNTQKLMPNDNFIIDQIFLPYTTQYKLIAAKDISQADALAYDTEMLADMDYDANYEAAQDALRGTEKVTINTPFNHLIYHVSETPNQPDEEGKNIMRQQALYMSDNMGKQLTKLHPDNEYVQSTKWMPQVARYYFITRSDSDGNGLIDEKDATHNYQIDFSVNTPVVKGYDF